MNSKTFLTKSFALLTLSALTLVACNKAVESPSEVLLKAKEASIAVQSGMVEVTAAAEGSNGQDDLKFSGDLAMTFDNADEKNRKLDMTVDLSGLMSAAEQSFNGDMNLQFIALSGQYFVKLNELESSDATVVQMKPFLEQYMGKWLRIAEDFIPQEIRNLQEEDEATKLKRKQLEDLFLETELFKVTKEYGVEKLAGDSVYHYALGVNKEAFADYMRQAAVIDGRELTDAEVKESTTILDYIQEVEVYIDTDSYYVHKATIRFSGEAIISQESSLKIEVTIATKKLNESVDIAAPESSEEFNPLNLVMGLGAVAPQSGTVPAEPPVDQESN